jgi:NAD-dependent dihydropyrimidine dehydrogenase PreA subunit
VIEIVSAERCTGCNICVAVCPTRVFDAVPAAARVIARRSDCQTCFMCELYCPEDALYVAPMAEKRAAVDEAATALGSYRRAVGWGRGQDSTAALDASYALMSRVR